MLFLVAVSAVCPKSSSSTVANASRENQVVLLHGLARSHRTMDAMQKALLERGRKTCNVDYPSTEHPVEKLALDFVLPAIEKCGFGNAGPVDFVTHSMGGIIVRYLAVHAPELEIGRVVMLSPPNCGSEVVDALGDTWLFECVNGPAGKQLGTKKDSLPNSLGPASFELGIITGDRSINWILSTIIDGEDDGKVSVERAKLEGMKDFIVIHSAHPFIMKNAATIMQTLHFLDHGKFKPAQP